MLSGWTFFAAQKDPNSWDPTSRGICRELADERFGIGSSGIVFPIYSSTLALKAIAAFVLASPEIVAARDIGDRIPRSLRIWQKRPPAEDRACGAACAAVKVGASTAAHPDR
jgi:hypothetical protein